MKRIKDAQGVWMWINEEQEEVLKPEEYTRENLEEIDEAILEIETLEED